MNCSKCNNEIPEGAKFCPVCGAACNTAPVVNPTETPAAKIFCQKCGLELEAGAKFCTVCGTPVGAAPAAASVSSGSGEISAVSLSKDSDSLVAAMNAAGSAPAAAPTAVPTPSGSYAVPGAVPTPSNTVPGNNGSFVAPNGYSSGFSGGYSGTAPAAPSAPPYTAPAAPAAAEMQNPNGNFIPGAAAAAVAPAKKKGPKVGLIIGIVLGVIVLAAGVFFLIDRSTFLSLFMGKPGYAAMVEGNSIKSVTEQIDTKTVSSGIKLISNVYASAATVNTSSNTYADMMDIAPGSSASAVLSLNTKDLIQALNTALQEIYGADSLTETVSAKVELSDTTKSMLKDSGVTDQQINDLLKLVNEFSITCGVNTNDTAAKVYAGVQSGTAVINAQVIMTDSGEFYITFPFGSETALKIKLENANASSVNSNAKPLELDEKELSALIEDLVKVYLKYYKAGVVSTESGELSAAGLTAKGKLITSEINGKALSDMFKEFGDTIANNKYLSDKLSEYVSQFGTTLTEDAYKAAVTSVFETAQANESDILSVKTVINNNGDVLAKSYEALSGEKSLFGVTVVDSGSQSGLAVTSNGNAVVYAACTKANDTDGNVKVSIIFGDNTFTLNADYSGVGTAKLCGKDVAVGTYTFSVVLPSDFTESGMDAQTAAILAKSSLTFSTVVMDENNAAFTISAKVGDYGTASVISTMTIKKENLNIAVPNDAIDITPAVNGGSFDDATAQKLQQYQQDLTAALQNIANSALPESLSSSVNNLVSGLAPKADPEQVSALSDRVYTAASEVMLLNSQYTIGKDDSQLQERANDLYERYNDLYSSILSKYSDMTPEELAQFETTASQLDELKKVLEDDYKAAAELAAANPGNGNTGSGSSRTDSSKLDFDSMDIETLITYLLEYENRFFVIEDRNEEIMANDNLNKLYEDAYDKYEAVFGALTDLYSNMSDSGEFSLPLLRKARSTGKEFAEAVETLEKAMSITT